MKKIKTLLISAIFMFGFNNNVDAASMSVWANVASTNPGQTVSISVSLSNVSGNFKVTSSNQSVLAGGETRFIDTFGTSNTFVFTFTAKNTGSATITVTPTDATTDEETTFTTTKSVSVSVVAKQSSSSGGNSGGSSNSGSSSNSGASTGGSSSEKKTYSSNNDLSSLSIEGYDLEPKFSKDTLEYKLEVDETVDKINIKASASDDEAEVKGTGEVNLSSGENIIEVKVIAENGNEKVYKIIINVVDKNPIEVTVDKKKYTVVKKNNDLLDKLEKFEETSIKINNQYVTAYTNKNSKLTLVILKDDKGEYNYFVFNSKKNSYELYREIKYNGITLFYNNMDNKLLPKGYKKYSFKYGELKLDGYKYNKKSDFYIFYAMNIDNGNLSLYTYDEKEKTIQRYNSDENNYLTASLSSILGKYKIVSYISTGIVCTMLVIGGIMLIKKRKMM